MASPVYDTLRKLLGFYFRDEFYTTGIEAARTAITENAQYRDKWPEIVDAITNRAFEPEEPLDLLIDSANLPLDDDTDEEAYVWLDKMVATLNRTDGVIDEY